MNWRRDLKGATGVVLDSMVLIYFLEDIAPYAALCETILEAAAAGVFSAVITPITQAELLVKPLKDNREDIANQYRAALSAIPNVRVIGMDPHLGFVAGALRAKYGLPLPDMFQVAQALRSPRPLLLTNDKALRQVAEVQIIMLDDLLPAS